LKGCNHDDLVELNEYLIAGAMLTQLYDVWNDPRANVIVNVNDYGKVFGEPLEDKRVL